MFFFGDGGLGARLDKKGKKHRKDWLSDVRALVNRRYQNVKKLPKTTLVFGNFLRRFRHGKIFDLKIKIALTNPLEIYMIGLTRKARKIGKRGGG